MTMRNSLFIFRQENDSNNSNQHKFDTKKKKFVKECKVKMFVVVFFSLLLSLSHLLTHSLARSLAHTNFAFQQNLCYSASAVSQRVSFSFFFSFTLFVSISYILSTAASEEVVGCERWWGQVKILRESFFYFFLHHRYYYFNNNFSLKKISQTTLTSIIAGVKDIHFIIITSLEYFSSLIFSKCYHQQHHAPSEADGGVRW